MTLFNRILLAGFLGVLAVGCGPSVDLGNPAVEADYASVRKGMTAGDLSVFFPHPLSAIRREEDLRLARSLVGLGKGRPSGTLLLRGIALDSDFRSMDFRNGISVDEDWPFGESPPELANLRSKYRKWMSLGRVLSLLPQGTEARFMEEEVDRFRVDAGSRDGRLRSFSGELFFVDGDNTGTTYTYTIILMKGIVASKERSWFTY